MIDKDEFIVGACWDVKGLLTRALGGCPSGPTEQELWAIEPDDEQAVRKVIRKYTRPLFLECKSDAEKGVDRCNWYERFKEGLRFLINLNDNEAFDWIGNVGQFFLYPCYEHPVKEYIKGDYHTFYIWIWEELCGEEDWRIPDIDAYLQNIDPYKNLEINEDGQWVPKAN